MSNLSRKTEDYLEAILDESLLKGYARNAGVSRRIGVSPPSVVEMFNKLDGLGFVTYRKYEGVVLTEEGRVIAQNIRDRHDTLKRLFCIINVPEDVADEDACLMEHELKSETVAQIRLLIEYLEAQAGSEGIRHDFRLFCAEKKADPEKD